MTLRLTRRAALLAGLLPLAPARAAAVSIPVLTWHRFARDAATASTMVTTAAFAEQIDFLVAQKFRFMTAREVVAAAAGQGGPIDGPAVCLTADDGFRTVYADMFPILRIHGVHATLFINPPMISAGGAYLTWPQIEEMLASGLVDIQPHTLTHPNFNTERARRGPADYAAFVHQEIAGAKQMIEAKLGGKADLLAWPYGIHNEMLEAAAAQAGCSAAFALGSRAVSAGDNAFALPRYQVYESDRGGRFGAVAHGVPRGVGRTAHG